VTLVPVAVFHGVPTMLAAFVHVIVAEYLSFIALLFALYTVAGGILVTGTIRARPWTNTAILALGTGMASIVGTTGAAMILIRYPGQQGAYAQHACFHFFHYPCRQCRRCTQPMAGAGLVTTRLALLLSGRGRCN
jgi:hypothetical protein